MKWFQSCGFMVTSTITLLLKILKLLACCCPNNHPALSNFAAVASQLLNQWSDSSCGLRVTSTTTTVTLTITLHWAILKQWSWHYYTIHTISELWAHYHHNDFLALRSFDAAGLLLPQQLCCIKQLEAAALQLPHQSSDFKAVGSGSPTTTIATVTPTISLCWAILKQ